MSLWAIILVLVGVIFLAGFNVLKTGLQKGEWQDRSAMVVAVNSFAATIAFFAMSFILGGPHLSAGWLVPIAITGSLNIIGQFARFRASALEQASLVEPIQSTTPAAVIVTGIFILGEYPTWWGWLGIWMLVVGSYVLNIQNVQQRLTELIAKEGKKPAWWRVYFAPFMALGKSRGVRWAFVALGLSVFTLPYDGLVVRRADVGFGYGCVFAIIGVGNLAIAIATGEHRRGSPVCWWGLLWRGAAIGLPNFVANALFGFAYQIAVVVYVGTMKRLSIPLTIVLAYIFLGERKSFRQRIVAGLIMAVGAAAIALGGK